MPPMTETVLRDIMKEVAGQVFAERMEESQAKGAEKVGDWQDLLKQISGSGSSAGVARSAADDKPGDRFFRSFGAMVAADMDVDGAKKWAKSKDAPSVIRKHAEVIERDLSSVIQTGGAVLIKEEISEDLIEFLRPAQVLTALGARDIQMGSTELTIPAQTVGSAGGWIGEGEPIVVTAPGFGGVTMRLHTYGSIVPIPNDLIRYSFVNAEAFVGADMRADVAVAMDVADLRGPGTNGQPLGLRWRGRVTRSLGDTTDNIINDLVAPFTRAGEANMPMQRMGWGINYRVWQKLFTMRDGVGGFLFKNELAGGTLMGLPFKRSTSFKSNLDPYATGTANKTEIAWFDLDSVMVARGDGVALDISREAAYESNGTTKSAYSRNQTVVRALIKNDVGLRYRDGAQYIDGINWINT